MRKYLATLALAFLIACGALPLSPDQPSSESFPPVDNFAPEFQTIGVDPSVFNEVSLLSPSNAGCVYQPSGPYSRVQSDPANVDSKNAVTATVILPVSKASSLESTPNSGRPRYTPNVYTGGGVAYTDSSGVKRISSIDAGFFSDKNGNWGVFINAGGVTTSMPTQPIGGQLFAYRIKGGTTPTIKVWVSSDGIISFTVSGDWVRAPALADQSKLVFGTTVIKNITITFSSPNATAWLTSGKGISWKFMNTVAIQPVPSSTPPIVPDGGYTTGDFAFSGSGWTGIQLGNAKPDGTLIGMTNFTPEQAFITDGKTNSISCVKPDEVVTATVGLPNISANIKLRVKGKYTRTPVNPLELIGSIGEKVTKKLSVTNTSSTPSSRVILNFTPPGGTAILPKNPLASGAKLEIPFSYTCASEGKVDKQFNVIYSENDTETSNVSPAVAGSFKYLTDTVTVTLNCIKNLDYTPKPLIYTGETDVGVTKTAPGAISFKNNAGKFTYTATSSDANLLQIVKGSGSTLNGETVTIETKIVCPATVTEKEVSITVTITNGKDGETKTEIVKVPVKCKAIKASINVTPSAGLTFEVPIGSSETQNITISNTGDIGSSLEYNQYGVSQSGVVLSQAASGGGLARAMVVQPGTYPSDPPPLVWANGAITPSSAQAGTLTKSGTDASSVVLPVTVKCTKPERGLTSTVLIVYLLGDVDGNGAPILDRVEVQVSVKCIGAAFYQPSFKFQSLTYNLNYRESDLRDAPIIYPVNTIYVSNVGVASSTNPALLNYSVTSSWTKTEFLGSSSGQVAPSPSISYAAVQMKFKCDLADLGSHTVSVSVSTNDLFMPMSSVSFTLNCVHPELQVIPTAILGNITVPINYQVKFKNAGNFPLSASAILFNFWRGGGNFNRGTASALQYSSFDNLSIGNEITLSNSLKCGNEASWGRVKISAKSNDYLNATYSYFDDFSGSNIGYFNKLDGGWFICAWPDNTLGLVNCYIQSYFDGERRYGGTCESTFGNLYTTLSNVNRSSEFKSYDDIDRALGLDNPLLEKTCTLTVRGTDEDKVCNVRLKL